MKGVNGSMIVKSKLIILLIGNSGGKVWMAVWTCGVRLMILLTGNSGGKVWMAL